MKGTLLPGITISLYEVQIRSCACGQVFNLKCNEIWELYSAEIPVELPGFEKALYNKNVVQKEQGGNEKKKKTLPLCP